ncbi:acetylornithine deacetylase [Antarcticimicrobium sediminis]|uniref:Acetylornithine deacetylase n=1 Tax=Antarcticimicrobium sediminis TaxID=2546227 RepID=A0A4R5EKQ9_9RHOB|nr:acetylornithine deacetylase [Antarcticimicrobium sediminis]TDE34930.1 acetylornithine deacetylase [Antarcticimicrobium sediminis]
MTPTERILRDLVAFDTTSAKSNLELMAYVQDYLSSFGIASRLIHDATGNKANLWATVGPDRDGGLVLNGHTDCVPVVGEVWQSDPFTLTNRDGKLFGRGSADMKGFVAASLAAVPELIAMNLERPVHLALSHDEEIGCIGVRTLLRDLSDRGQKPAMCIVGEPTLMQVVTGHKGGRAYRCHFTGHAVHSSLAPQGQNAIESAAALVMFLKGVAADLAAGPSDADFDLVHSTLSVGMIQGGTAINIVPADATVTFEFRNLLEVDQQEIFDRIEGEVFSRILPEAQQRFPGASATFEQIYEYPAHAINANAPLVSAMKHIVGRNDHSKVAFGAEAGLFLRELGLPTVLCGPGSISVAHRPDEYVERSQLAKADAMLRRAAQEFCK